MFLLVLIFGFGVFCSPLLSLNTNNVETVKWTVPKALPNALNTQSGYKMVFIEALGGFF